VGAGLLGGGLGFLLSWMTSKIDDHLIEITLSGSFLLAEKAHASGVLACLSAGMLTGNFGAKYGMSASTRVAVVSFWEYVAFVANSIIFLLIGLDVDPVRLLGDWRSILITWLAMLAAQAALVGATLPLLQRLEGAMPRGFGLVIGWGGVRGGVAMVLALGIPREFPQRELAVNCIFGASLLTILVQSTTVGLLLRRLGLVVDRGGDDAVARLRGRRRALDAALRYLERQRELGGISSATYEEIRQELSAESKELAEEREKLKDLSGRVAREEVHALRRQLLMVRKEALRQASLEGSLDEKVTRKLVGEIDQRLFEAEGADGP
jgi:monovalent cation:H+ antiporter, CPA1 family